MLLPGPTVGQTLPPSRDWPFFAVKSVQVPRKRGPSCAKSSANRETRNHSGPSNRSNAPFLPLLPALLLVSIPLIAQQPAGRIAEDINPNALSALRGSVSPRVASAANLGPLDPATPMNGVTLYFQPSPAQKAELDALVQAQQTPGSPLDHAWITPAEYAARFGLSNATSPKSSPGSRLRGSTSTALPSDTTASPSPAPPPRWKPRHPDQSLSDGETHFANASDLQIPAALVGVVQSVRNLNDFRPKPQIHVPANPQFTAKSTNQHFLTPKDVATIYDINSAYTSGYTGSGQTIVVVGQWRFPNPTLKPSRPPQASPSKIPTRSSSPAPAPRRSPPATRLNPISTSNTPAASPRRHHRLRLHRK